MSHIPSKAHTRLQRLTVSALCLALCLVLPFLTGQIPQIGGMLSPMHIPVYLCGFLCGPWWAGAVGLIAPLLRNLLFHMPPILTAVAMTFELAAYGIAAGLFWHLFRRLTDGKFWVIYPALLCSMLCAGSSPPPVLRNFPLPPSSPARSSPHGRGSCCIS